MKSIDLGKISIRLDDYASQGNAILGIRDSGKSYTATAIAERLMDARIPIIAFDPIGIWRNLRVPGAGKGYEVVVAGGRNGDLPLTARGAQEIVRAAMRENVSLIVDLYDIHLSKADWREIVASSIRALLYENGDHGLRHIFIEEAAEFCPQIISTDQGRVYAEVEKLARMGGNALLGYTLINQRAEQVNKAVLELCDCMILHRQKGRNSITALSKWLDIASAHDSKALIASLPGLAQGECWVWPAGADAPVRTKIPTKNSSHPDRRARQAAALQSEAGIDVSAFVAAMRLSLEAVTKEAEANDPKLLRAEIARLKREAAKPVPAEQVTVPDPEAEKRGYARGYIQGRAQGRTDALNAIHALEPFVEVPDGLPARPAPRAPTARSQRAPAPRAVAAQPAEGVSRSQQRILDALAYLETVGVMQPSKDQLALWAECSPTSGGYFNNLGALRSMGLLDYPAGGTVALTDTGRSAAQPAEPQDTEEMQEALCRRVGNSKAAILRALIDIYPKDIAKDDLAGRIGVSPTSGGYFNNLGALRTLGVIDYPTPGRVAALPVLFLD